MPSVVDWDDQAVDITELDAGQEREQSATRDDGERWLTAALQNEWVQLRKIDTPQTRRAIKIIMFYMLVEVNKVPIETVCKAFSAYDHPGLGLATADRYLSAAPEFLKLRILANDQKALALFQPSELLSRDLQELQHKIDRESRLSTPNQAHLTRWQSEADQVQASLEEIQRKEAAGQSDWLDEWERTYRDTIAAQLKKTTRRAVKVIKKTQEKADARRQQLLFG